MKKTIRMILSLVLVLVLGATVFTACGEKKTECEKNGHSFATEWLNDATDHWHKCANCNEVSDKAAHVYDNDVDATCNTCGYERAAHTAHTVGTVWENDETNHWHVCTASGCEEKLDTAAHTWNAGEITTPATFTSCPGTTIRRSSAALLSSAAWAATTAGAQSPMQTPALRWRREPRSVLRFKNKNLLG